MTSIQQISLSSERVRGPPSANVDLLECSICRYILWKPIACKSCETPFCLPCINQWLTYNPNTCPNRCNIYNERRCPSFIAKLLAQLQISCCYQSNGCEQILPYEALDKHEIECDYQSKQCPGCKLQMLKKDFSKHQNTCELIDLTCEDCKFMYKRNEAETQHTESVCLKNQIKRVKHELEGSEAEIEKLKSQIADIQKLHSILSSKRITFEDLPSAINHSIRIPDKYNGLTWTNIHYMHELLARGKYPKSGYITSFMPAGNLQIAFFCEGATISIDPPNELFTLISFIASAAWNHTLQLAIMAYRNAEQIYYCEVTLFFGRPQRILLQWENIDQVILKAFGGIPHPNNPGNNGAHVALTELVVNNLTKTKDN